MSLIVKPFFSSATVFLLMIIYFGRTTAEPNYIYHFCIGGNYTSNSTFQDNLNSLLFSLTLSTRGKLEKRSVGSNPDTVYGFLQCRGDVSSAICTDCVDTATIDLVNRFCPNSREAIIWYDECMLRYSNRSFFSIMQENPGVYLFNTQNFTDPDRFNPALGDLMNDLATLVSSSPKNTTLYATGERKVTAFENVYGIVQCTVDINPSSCNRCLRGAIADLPLCCNGKQGGRVIRPSCYLRYENYPFIRTNETDEDIHSPPPPLIPSPSSPTNGAAPSSNENWMGQKNSKTRIYKVVVPVVVTALVIAFAICFCLIRRKAMKEKAYTENIQAPTLQLEESANDLSDSSKHNEVQADGVEVPFFEFETILAATNNFSNSNRLGQGGFGPVYKGTFRGTDLAVKRLSRSSGQGLEEFKNEVLLIAKLQHRNLVRLLGYCIKGEEKMLLYEYMPNKSLDSFIFDRTPCRLLNWEKRLNIILGTARGILYLHQDSRLRIIHRDLKTSNILLDEEMNPKISDFGMARIFGGTQTQGNTNRVVGTYGYMSPEYALDGVFSVKSDVYSFGVVILEIISGKKNTGFYNSEESLSLIGFAWKLWNKGKAVEFVDHSLGEACNVGEVLKCIHVGLLCVQEDATDRPTMSSVILMLSSETISLPTPKQPAFFFRKYNSSTSTSSDRPESCSRNEMTVSAQEGR